MIATRSKPSPRNHHDAASETVAVRYGTHRLVARLAGLTIGEVKAGLRDRWGVAYFAAGVLNGQVSEVAIRLQVGDRLEFRRFGFKGGEDNPYAEADLLIANRPELQKIIAEENSVDAVRKTVQFCFTRFGRPGQGDMALVNLLLERVVVLIAQLGNQIDATQQHAEQTEREAELRSPYLTAQQAAAYLRISYSTFRNKARLIKVMPGTHRYRREDLDEYSRAHRPRRKR